MRKCFRDLLNISILVVCPKAYASYIKDAPLSDRFYDDNVWLGIDFTDVYLMTSQENYLQSAKLIWKFIESGMDDCLGGGIYWCEQKKESKKHLFECSGYCSLYEAV